MRILLTNDDGIHAPGLKVLEEIARELSDDLWIFAPETDQSGVSHSLSLNDPLRLRMVDERRYAVKGTPTDCVIMGLRHVLKDNPPDLILSGVNRGQNVAEDVTYSGTIAGAMEGTLLGVPSIALSQAYGSYGRAAIPWNCARTHAPGVIRRLIEAGIEPGILVNVNFPACEPSEVKGTAVTVQGRRDQALLNIEERHDGRGNPYYWLIFAREKQEAGAGTDLRAIAENRISITPLELDLTHEPTMTRYARIFG
ncbi:5'/3'-nucleotidase SurE [Chelatococcus composti]|jgi:5'-nucleotidase|uniref:5'-nucleotidase SurE n=1 Tax=Chelatococcus composti TaxID=1743235 RepID=A0A841K468_9HYPH|nr:5'/3'-nucleotidase SurE [Chelatococcus composti]MBB6166790.1 5'-nucleotidase [Chelatococcus composti]MBS7734284.1 5'/3'-nucleotidase SurE [Chelatococcus composti]PZN46181.1 MAG: 5'/3'-nucleotidase SurE [Pseudomonadota bacterium]GGG25726.1 5'-nucleotidase SurE [Chelatococcus composti]